jgi:methionyl-tRNA formyltransferase
MAPRVVFIGAYAYARQALESLPVEPVRVITRHDDAPRQQYVHGRMTHVLGDRRLKPIDIAEHDPDLVVVAGWRELVPIVAPTVGFHSAKLPEYPGRAPVANAILRGDRTITNTMLWLDDGIDSGDIIGERTFGIGIDPDAIYIDIGISSAEMLRTYWEGLLDGTAPRQPQDMSRRGPETPADAWQKLESLVIARTPPDFAGAT